MMFLSPNAFTQMEKGRTAVTRFTRAVHSMPIMIRWLANRGALFFLLCFEIRKNAELQKIRNFIQVKVCRKPFCHAGVMSGLSRETMKSAPTNCLCFEVPKLAKPTIRFFLSCSHYRKSRLSDPEPDIPRGLIPTGASFPLKWTPFCSIECSNSDRTDALLISRKVLSGEGQPWT